MTMPTVDFTTICFLCVIGSMCKNSLQIRVAGETCPGKPEAGKEPTPTRAPSGEKR